MLSLDLLLLVPILLPLCGAALVFLLRAHRRLQEVVVVSTAFLTLGAVAAVYHVNPGHRLELIFIHLVDFGLSFRPTHLGALFALISAGIGALVSLYAMSYMRSSHSQTRFSSFLLVSLSGCLGVFLAGDYFTLFLFFEIMTFAAYPLVIHDEDDEAMRAGDSYLYMGVTGGLVLLFGILLLVWSAGTADIVPVLDRLQGGAVNPYLIAIIFLIGFGVKAGLIPLHVWIPHAYPVAPAPATALLAGVMGKTGFYGILSVLAVTLSSSLPSQEVSALPINIGFALIWVALLTILGGAVMALLQNNVKRLLAYSSISQMGYVMLAVGCAAYLGAKGGLPYTAAVFHAFNHAVLKAGLFIMMGSVYLRTGSLELSKLGGMAKVLPLTALATLVATLSVIGVPGLSGFGSKKLIQYGIDKAAAYHGEPVLAWVGPLFMLGSVLTVTYLIKLYYGVFLGSYRGRGFSAAKEGSIIPAVLAAFAGGIVAIGLFPERVINMMARSATATAVDFGMMAEQLGAVKLWTASSYIAGVIPVALGVVVFLAARRYRFGTGPVPCWLSVEALLYRPVTQGFLRFCCNYVTRVEGGLCDLYDRGGSVSHSVFRRVKKFDDMLGEGYETAQRTTSLVVEQARGLEQGLGQAYDSVGQAAEDITRRIRNEAAGDNGAAGQRPEMWNPQNVTLGSLVVAAVMLMVLLVLYTVGSRIWQ